MNVRRSILNGAVARSTVRRHPKQSAFLKQVGSQTRVIKLQGFLFFGSSSSFPRSASSSESAWSDDLWIAGTISAVESSIRSMLEAAGWSSNPIRFLVLDFSMAGGTSPSPSPLLSHSLPTRRCRLLSGRSLRPTTTSTGGQGRRPRSLWLSC